MTSIAQDEWHDQMQRYGRNHEADPPPDEVNIRGYQYKKVVQHPAFLGDAALGQIVTLAERQLYGNYCHDDDRYFGAITKTMEALKDLVEYTIAQIKVIEMTYKDDPVRRDMFCNLLRSGFRALCEQSMHNQMEVQMLKHPQIQIDAKCDVSPVATGPGR